MQVQSVTAAKAAQRGGGDVSILLQQYACDDGTALQNVSVDSFDLSSSDPIPTSQPYKVYVNCYNYMLTQYH